MLWKQFLWLLLCTLAIIIEFWVKFNSAQAIRNRGYINETSEGRFFNICSLRKYWFCFYLLCFLLYDVWGFDTERLTFNRLRSQTIDTTNFSTNETSYLFYFYVLVAHKNFSEFISILLLFYQFTVLFKLWLVRLTIQLVRRGKCRANQTDSKRQTIPLLIVVLGAPM